MKWLDVIKAFLSLKANDNLKQKFALGHHIVNPNAAI
jgi:hypothetical protein